MVSEEEPQIRTFVRQQLREQPDLSLLTLGILKRRYLAFVGREALSPEVRHVMKRVTKEELTRMQASDRDVSKSDSPPAVRPQSKRKRGKENEEVIIGSVVDEDESSAKKCRRQSSSSEIEEEEDHETKREESEEEDQINEVEDEDEDDEQKVRLSPEKATGISEEAGNGEDAAEGESSASENHEQGKELAETSSDDDDDQKQTVKTPRSGKKKTKNTRKGKKTSPSQSDEGDESGSDGGSDGKMEDSPRRDGSESSEEHSEPVGKPLMEKKNAELVEDSDSSSLPSLGEERDSGAKNPQPAKNKKTVRKEESETIPKREKEDDKAVLRLKRYIGLCGVRRNYKRLLEDCRSVRSMVAVLKKELEDLGVHGQPSIEKCKKARLKREEAQELAELDVSNIIATEGRPKRRGASAWQKQHVPSSSTFRRTVNSSSDSGEDDHAGRGRRRATDWGNLQGIISDDADSG